MKDSAVVCLQFPAENEPVCLPGPPDRATWFGGYRRPRVSRDGDTVTVCAARWEWAEWLFVVKALKERSSGEKAA